MKGIHSAFVGGSRLPARTRAPEGRDPTKRLRCGKLSNRFLVWRQRVNGMIPLSNRGRRLVQIPVGLLLLLLAVLVLPAAAPANEYSFDWKYRSSSTIDSTRKDSYALTYDPVTFAPIIQPQAYDKSFFSSTNDLNFALKFDLSESQILDFKETFHYQKFRPEDYTAFALDTYKYSYLDHHFNLTYALSLGQQDAIQLDYVNAIYRVPIDPLNEFVSNTGKARFHHRVNPNTSIGIEGNFEEREFLNDRASNFREGTLIIDFSRFFPQRLHYRPVANSTRGDTSTFTSVPSGLTAKKVVDYYTNWAPSPHNTDPQAKYVPVVVRGDLSFSLIGDFRQRERVTIDNEYQQPAGILKMIYDASDKWKFTLDNTYYQRQYKNESAHYYLFNHTSEKVTLGTTYRPDRKFSHILSYSYENYHHDSYKEHDYDVNTFAWEMFFRQKKNLASLFLKQGLQHYTQPRPYYPNSNQFQAVLAYDYSITPSFLFHIRNEYVDYDYHEYQDLFFSTFQRNTWKVSFEKLLSEQHTLELGYQDKRERHDTYASNDISEKTLFFSWFSTL
jgi:hypothetical protein